MIPAGAHEWAPYCGPAPVPAESLRRWNVDPILATVLIGIAVWSLTWGRHQVQRPRFFWAAFGLAVVLFVSPFCALTSALFSARVVHHVARLLVLGANGAIVRADLSRHEEHSSDDLEHWARQVTIPECVLSIAAMLWQGLTVLF